MRICLTEQELESLAAGELSEENRSALRAHLESCPRCSEALAEWQANREFLVEVGEALAAGIPDGEDNTASILESESGSVSRFEGAPAPGAVEIPGYRIVRPLQQGGQGAVYEAVQEGTEMRVAIKVLLEDSIPSVSSRWRFEREVRLVAELQHPNIISIHGSGLTHGRHYFVMDFIQGQRLDTYVRHARMSVPDVIRLFVQICDAVAYAHRKGVIHRDLKPSNVIVDEDGRPYVLDFGLAKEVTGKSSNLRHGQITMPGNILGTLAYMSPEQTKGEVESLDTRTDVYSLGVILYELLTGSRPYDCEGDLVTALRNIRMVDPPRPSRTHGSTSRKGVNSEIDAIVLKAMEKDPDRRYQSANELAADLRALLSGDAVSARSASSMYVLYKLASRHYFHTSVISALVIAIVGFGAAYYSVARDERTRRLDQERIARGFEQQNQQLMASAELARTKLDLLPLDWFVREWQAGRLEVARRVQALLMRPGSPEYAAAAFLLDETWTTEDLAARIPSRSAALVHLAAGERHARAGRLNEARQAFEQYLKRPGLETSAWVPLIRERLAQLVNGTTGSPTTQPEP